MRPCWRHHVASFSFVSIQLAWHIFSSPHAVSWNWFKSQKSYFTKYWTSWIEVKAYTIAHRYMMKYLRWATLIRLKKALHLHLYVYGASYLSKITHKSQLHWTHWSVFIGFLVLQSTMQHCCLSQPTITALDIETQYNLWNT